MVFLDHINAHSDRYVRGAAVTIVIAVLLIALGSSLFGDGAAKPPTDTDACVAARQFVTPHLRYPSSAQHPVCSRDNLIAVQDGNAWIVTNHVMAQNSYGAVGRVDYVAWMTFASDNRTWHLLDITVAGEGAIR